MKKLKIEYLEIWDIFLDEKKKIKQLKIYKLKILETFFRMKQKKIIINQ